MKNISEQMIKDLIDQGVDTFFGVQGGACARLIDNVIKYKAKYIPVLNEQAAGYYAHGYYLAKKKTAGLIFTTGPGLTNGLSGIAACYYDRIPLVVLVGQVIRKLNIAKSTKTRMVGFQEVPHLDLSKPISDKCFKIDTKEKYSNIRNDLLTNLNSKVQVIEFLDDVQRFTLNKKFQSFKDTSIKKKNKLPQSIINYFKNSKKPLFILGSGFAQNKDCKELLNIIKKLNVQIATTWGGQRMQNILSKSDGYVGLIGNHNPGYGNKILEESDIVFSLGCSLLQHQVGKDYSKFAPAAKIVYVNNDIKECKRAQLQFGKRLEIANLDISDFVKNITKFKKKKITIKNSAVENKIFYPVNHLVKILEEIKKTKDEAIIFSDAGATLSWTYQAANKVEKCPPIFTSFNLHSMGYANCAAIGAAVAGKKVYCIIGDGSIPMNSQEFAWLKKYSVKLIILDNNGYGIIRQTQKDFYHSKFFGSDFENNFSSLPKFSIEKIIKSFDIPLKKINKIDIGKRDIDWLNFSDKTRAIIIKIKYEARVTTA